MKTIFAILFSTLALLTTSWSAYGNALASIYNGEQFMLDNQLLVQDAGHPDDFYILPQTFHVKRGTNYDEETRAFTAKAAVNHRVVTIGSNQYSDYTMRLELGEPGQLEMLKAAMNLRRIAGPNARIKGAAPICGMALDMPGLSTSAEVPNPAVANPKATFIQYSISSTEAGKCNSVLATTEFTLEYRVPIALEPGIAKNITTEVGLVLQPIELTLPYKYKEQVSLTIDAQSAIEQLKMGADIQGSLKAVTLGIQARMEKMMNALQISGQLNVDCQNPDKTACDRFVAQAQEILSKTFYNYLPMSGGGDTNPLIVADKDKAVNATMFKAQLAFDQSSAERIGKFKVDFSNTMYDSVHAQVQIDASKVPVEVLDPIVRKMLEGGV